MQKVNLFNNVLKCVVGLVEIDQEKDNFTNSIETHYNTDELNRIEINLPATIIKEEDFENTIQFWIKLFDLNYWSNIDVWHSVPTKLFEVSTDGLIAEYKSSKNLLFLVDVVTLATLLDCNFLEVELLIDKPRLGDEDVSVALRLVLHSTTIARKFGYTPVCIVSPLSPSKTTEHLAFDVVDRIYHYIIDRLVLGELTTNDTA